MSFTVQGKIIFDPTAGKAKNPWWVILECPEDIREYYQHVIEKYHEIKLNKPLFKSHISVVRGEELPDSHKHLWRVRHEEEISFTYSTNIETYGDFFYLPVQSTQLEDLRSSLGLSSQPEFGYHLTIGKVI